MRKLREDESDIRAANAALSDPARYSQSDFDKLLRTWKARDAWFAEAKAMLDEYFGRLD